VSKPNRFPFEKIFSYQGFEEQIAYELSLFNWYLSVQESQRAFWQFAIILRKILADKENRIVIDKKKANRFLTLYFGQKSNGEPKTDTAKALDRGLYALDIIEREFDEGYGILTRGWGASKTKKKGKTIWTPAIIGAGNHHTMVMRFHSDMQPIMFDLWHEIASVVEIRSGGVPAEWLKENKSPSEEESEEMKTENFLEERRLIEAGKKNKAYPNRIQEEHLLDENIVRLVLADDTVETYDKDDELAWRSRLRELGIQTQL
jgi:hypothetical protein